jgi:hypothetical protein
MSVPAPLRLDLAPDNRRSPALGWVLLALGATSLVLAALQFQSAHAARAREADELRELQARVAEAGASSRPVSSDSRDAREAAAVIRELRVPWPLLLAVFEGAANQNVALLAIEPTPAQQQVRLTAEAKNVQSMFDYLEALRRDPLTDVVLLSHQVNEKAPGSPLRFQAQAIWKTN